MTLFDTLSLYCERTNPSLWSEPLNVLSSFAFLLAAWLLWRRQLPSEARREAHRMAVLIASVGLCSAVFHLSAQRWALWLDIGAIVLFIIVFIQRYLSRVMRTPNGGTALAILGLLALMRVIQSFGDLNINGSEPYLVPWLGLAILSHWAARKSMASRSWVLSASVLFPLALLLRSFDLALCKTWPTGTHAGWHVLAALMLYLCARGLAAGCHERSGSYHGLLS